MASIDKLPEVMVEWGEELHSNLGDIMNLIGKNRLLRELVSGLLISSLKISSSLRMDRYEGAHLEEFNDIIDSLKERLKQSLFAKELKLDKEILKWLD